MYEQRSLLAAAGFLHEISVAIRRIGEAPHRYPVALHGTRCVLLERFPFSIHYRVSENDVVVVAVAHQKRRPGIGQAGSAQPDRRLHLTAADSRRRAAHSQR